MIAPAQINELTTQRLAKQAKPRAAAYFDAGKQAIDLIWCELQFAPAHIERVQALLALCDGTQDQVHLAEQLSWKYDSLAALVASLYRHGVLIDDSHEATPALLCQDHLVSRGRTLRARMSAEVNLLSGSPRYTGPATIAARATYEEVTIDRITIPAGELILLLLGAANVDPSVFPHPDQFDIQRANTAHLAFGSGFHACLGSQFSRMEASVALSHLLSKFTHIPHDETGLRWVDAHYLRALENFPCVLKKTPTRTLPCIATTME